MKLTAHAVGTELNKYASSTRATISQRFFKTGKGQYGFGDIFIGVKVPDQRIVAKKFHGLPLNEIKKLLDSNIHEHRLTGLLILVRAFAKGNQEIKTEIAKFYLKNVDRVNNWDLVDSSAEYILGPTYDLHKAALEKLSKSKNIWHRRVSVLATFHFIKKGSFAETLRRAKQMLADEHDLIHKATGWMLREIGKRNPKELMKFLNANYRKMPRTMLRYAIEKLPLNKRKYYLKTNAS